MKNLIIGLIVSLVAVMWGYYYFQSHQLPTYTASKITPTINLSVSMYPSITPTMPLSPTPEISDEDAITKAFADKYQKKTSDIKLKLSQNTGSLAQGSVSFKGEQGGGWWLAAKDAKSNWIIVQDGNGYVSCEAIKPYNFPKSMIPECVDSKGKLKIL